jgi:2'-5' RNA ligase
MSDQLSLPGLEALQKPAPPADHLFFAFVPPAAVIQSIAERTRQFRTDLGLRGKALAPSCLHVSLHGLGIHHDVPSRLIEAVSVAASSVIATPFEVSFDRALSFANRRAAKPFVLRATNVAALHAFHRALGEAMTKAGLGRWVFNCFTPHMTLLYDRRLVDEHAIERVSWTVTEFVLVHSFVGQGRHVHLARWPLRG